MEAAVHFYPDRGWQKAWVPDPEIALSTARKLAQEGKNPLLRVFANTRRGEGEVFLIEYRIREVKHAAR